VAGVTVASVTTVVVATSEYVVVVVVAAVEVIISKTSIVCVVLVNASVLTVAAYDAVSVLVTLMVTEVVDLTTAVGTDKQEHAVDSSAEANEARYAGIETRGARFAWWP
jgi:hypothetical protein